MTAPLILGNWIVPTRGTLHDDVMMLLPVVPAPGTYVLYWPVSNLYKGLKKSNDPFHKKKDSTNKIFIFLARIFYTKWHKLGFCFWLCSTHTPYPNTYHPHPTPPTPHPTPPTPPPLPHPTPTTHPPQHTLSLSWFCTWNITSYINFLYVLYPQTYFYEIFATILYSFTNILYNGMNNFKPCLLHTNTRFTHGPVNFPHIPGDGYSIILAWTIYPVFPRLWNYINHISRQGFSYVFNWTWTMKFRFVWNLNFVLWYIIISITRFLVIHSKFSSKIQTSNSKWNSKTFAPSFLNNIQGT